MFEANCDLRLQYFFTKLNLKRKPKMSNHRNRRVVVTEEYINLMFADKKTYIPS